MKNSRLGAFAVTALVVGLLSACSGKTMSDKMYIKPATLSKQELDMAELLGKDDGIDIFDFVVDNNVRKMCVSLYQLADDTWQPLVSGSGEDFTDTKGRLALDYDKLAKGYAESLKSDNFGGRIAYERAVDASLLEASAILTSRLSEKESIVYDAEIPLVLQIMSSQDEMHSYTMSKDIFEHPEQYAAMGYDDVYMITVRFSADEGQ